MIKTGQEAEDKTPEPEVSIRIQEIIGRSLRAHYDDVVAAPMPDRFLVLLTELEAKELKLAQKGAANV